MAITTVFPVPVAILKAVRGRMSSYLSDMVSLRMASS